MTKDDKTGWLDEPGVLAVAFHPRTVPAAIAAPGCELLDIPVAEGVIVGARFYAAGKDKPTILFFHGNGEIVADYASLAPIYLKMGVNFFPVDYRGYGRSSGRPTISSMLADARTVFDYAKKRLSEKGYTGPVIVMGRSLGSAPALEIASTRPDDVAALIIDSGFADVTALLLRLGARPPKELPRDTIVRQEEKIKAYKGPSLIIHGTHDMIIPVSDAETLHQASPSTSKRLLTIEGAGHNNLMFVGMDRYMQAVAELVRSTRPVRRSPEDGT